MIVNPRSTEERTRLLPKIVANLHPRDSYRDRVTGLKDASKIGA